MSYYYINVQQLLVTPQFFNCNALLIIKLKFFLFLVLLTIFTCDRYLFFINLSEPINHQNFKLFKGLSF